MQIRKPAYFDHFRCLAGACPDSCCKEWGVAVDAGSAARYRALDGALGDRLREVLSDEDGETYLSIVDGRCPMWRNDGLCRIQAELGEEALCATCRAFPRLTHDYGNFIEYGLELSCPEAARLILSEDASCVCTQVDAAASAEYDPEVMDILLRTRETARDLLADRRYTVPEALALLLMFASYVQPAIDGDEMNIFIPELALDSAKHFAKRSDCSEMLAFFADLEILTDEWRTRLCAPTPRAWDERDRAIARYLIDRYYLQAVSDYDLVSRIKFIVISCIVLRHLGGDLLRTAQLYSKEIENDADNVDALLDAAYLCPAFTDEKLLGALLLGKK